MKNILHFLSQESSTEGNFSRKGAKAQRKPLKNRGGALRLCAFARNILWPRLRFTLIALVLLVTLSATASAKVPEGWLNGATNFEKAMQLHRELKVPLVVYFYVDWCPYCNTLENEYFPAAAMRDYLRGVVKIRINPELTRADYELGSLFGIGGYPAFFVVGPGSFPVQLSPFRRDGRSLTPAEFAQRCRDVTTPRNANGMQSTEAPKATAKASATKAPGAQMTIVETASPEFVSNAPLPTADAVLANYARLTGNSSTTGKFTSRVIKGRISVAGLNSGGRFEFYATASGKLLTVINVDSLGVMKQGFDGRATWKSSENGTRGASLPENVLAITDFYRDAKLSELYPKTKLLGKVKEGDREIYLIEAAPAGGTAEKLYFDVQSGMLVHRDFTRASSRGPIQSEIYFSDWRNVDGVRLPCSLTQTIGNLTLVITIDEIRHNVAIDEALFQRPGT